MIVVAYVPLIIAIVGLLLWAFIDGAAHPVTKEAGKLIFFAGLFWFVYPLSGHTIKIGGP